VWNNAEWATDRFEDLSEEKKTAGWYCDETGQPHKILSGDEKGADAERARAVLHAKGAATAKDGTYPAASHVEVKAAAMLREDGRKAGLVVINNDRGPCDYTAGLSRVEVLPMVLPSGATLRVWWPQADGPMRFRDFTGR
jgi:hypothetical protein